MSLQTPLPFAFAQREEFLSLPLDQRPPHLWRAYQFCQEQIGRNRFADEELERNLGVLRRMMLAVAKHMAIRLRDDGSWRNSEDPRWPRNHAGADPDHWYDTGAFPPQFLALPSEPEHWRQVLNEQPEALFDEMIAWAETPAGQAGVNDGELQKLLSDRDSYATTPERSDALAPHTNPADSAGLAEVRANALSWLSERSSDGSLSVWATALKLAALDKFLGGVSSNRRSMERLLPELMKMEVSGEWARLESHLESQSPEDAEQLKSLRRCLSEHQP